jgi:hypothetical protein
LGNAEKRRARAKAKRKENELKRQARLQGGQPRSPGKPFFRIQCPTPQDLATVGPLIVGEWSVPDVLAQALRAAGRPVPPPVTGHLLVDTGATRTCIALEVAQQLGLSKVGVGKTYGAGGLHENLVFAAVLKMNAQVPNSTQGFQFMAIQPVMAVPDLSRGLRGTFDLNTGQQIVLVGLLGRDFLRHTRIDYRGNEGVVEIHVDTGLMLPAPGTGGRQQP